MIAQYAANECRSKCQQALDSAASAYRELATVRCQGWDGSAAYGAMQELRDRANGVRSVVRLMGTIRHDLNDLDDQIYSRTMVVGW